VQDDDGNYAWVVSKKIVCERIAVGFAPKLESLPGVFSDEVELYVRPRVQANPKCVDCSACYDADAQVRRGAWARVAFGQFRRSALQALQGHRVCTDVFLPPFDRSWAATSR
jgi:hypothetical protein